MRIPSKMRAAVLYGPEDLRLVEDYPVPRPGPDEVLIRVEACAICGTDPKILAHGWPGQPPYGQFIFGHEYAGEVVAKGEQVDEFTIGDRVVVEPHKGCGVCANCRDGHYTTCLNYGNLEKGHRHYGFTVNGGYAEYACNHISSVYKIPGNMSYEEATLLTTAATALYGIERVGGVNAGETWAVFGPGPIGLTAVALLRRLGAGRIILTGTRDERLSLGKKLGADVLLNVRTENIIERVFELTDGVGADAVLECSGSPRAAADAVECCKKNGRIGLVGIYDQTAEIDINKVVQWNISISGSKAEGERSVAKVVELIKAQPIDFSLLITHRFPLKEICRAFEVARTRAGGAIKVVIHCQQ